MKNNDSLIYSAPAESDLKINIRSKKKPKTTILKVITLL